MTAALASRGPDEQDEWCDRTAGIALGHRRLAVIDPSPAGHQPMTSPSGRYVMVYNGEAYNHLELREELGERAWRGHSDTETLLACFDAFGIEPTLERAVGMFAFAVWDRSERSLVLARDRFGEKPLYYGWQGGTFLFASDLRALRLHPKFEGGIDRNALALYLRFGYVPTPRSIYEGIRKLTPGTCLLVRAGEEETERPYWSVADAFAAARRNPFTGAAEEACEELEALLGRAVRGQMVADVPLGAFLSGGIDSTSVVALMQEQVSRPVKTFTIGFGDPAYDEAPQARAVAKHLGCEHTELYVSAEDAMAVIPQLGSVYDEPFADSSQIPTFLVSRLARRHVTVSLSGDGGDELFGGYNRHVWAETVWPRLQRLPRPLRSTLSGALVALPPRTWDDVLRTAAPILPSSWRYSNPGDKLHKLAGVLGAAEDDEAYLTLVSQWRCPEKIVDGSVDVESLSPLPPVASFDNVPPGRRMMLRDTLTYLPDDILTKVDRAAMAVSLETRVPFLDHRVAELAWRLPLSMLVREGRGKWLLRRILSKRVPTELFDRPKAGFALPLDVWLRGPLREWAEDLLAERRLKRQGMLRAEPIQAEWREHLSGRRNRAGSLWAILMFQSWLEAEGAR